MLSIVKSVRIFTNLLVLTLLNKYLIFQLSLKQKKNSPNKKIHKLPQAMGTAIDHKQMNDVGTFIMIQATS